MQIEAAQGPVHEQQVDAVIVGVGRDHALSEAAAEVNKACGGTLVRVLENEGFSGKVGEAIALHALAGVVADVVVVTGLEARDLSGATTAYRAAGTGAQMLSGRLRKRVVLALGMEEQDEQLESAVVGAAVGCHGQDLHRTERKRFAFETLAVATANENALRRAAELAKSVNLARRLVNEPADRIYPETFANEASRVAEEVGLEFEVWDAARLAQERMGSMLAVARGSSLEPRLVILRHQGRSDDRVDLAVAGKGVTFDSGGLSLKSSESMKTMKCDMGGAATVLAAMRSIAERNVKANVWGLMGLVENMPGPSAMRLGDVLTARNGTTIEVMNTDAEGRLVLADVLSFAAESGAARLIDLATLTGACVVALGNDVAGLMSNDADWCRHVNAAASACGEAVWELPMNSDFDAQIRSEIADIKNTGDGRWGGAITAAKFLERFVDSRPWVHMDIAGPAYADKPKPWIDAGASGLYVRTVVEAAESLAR